jgi:hypothetical protein
LIFDGMVGDLACFFDTIQTSKKIYFDEMEGLVD